MRILREENAAEIGGVMQCFNEDWAMAKQAIDMNFCISFAGLAILDDSAQIKKVIKSVPLDRMLVETDAPYFAPPFCGTTNEPAFLRYIVNYVAQLRNLDIEEVANITTKNFFQLFNGAIQPQIV